MVLPASATQSSFTELKLSCLPPDPAVSVDTASANPDTFMQSLQEFADEMVKQHGFDKKDLHCIFSQIQYNRTAHRLIAPPPAGSVKNWQGYRARFINASRIAAGSRFWQEHEDALKKAEKVYGIPPEIIVGIIGVETLYGKNKGNFSVLNALATLAFDYPEHPKRSARMALFKKELENALLLCAEQDIAPFSLKGSYAGAIGWPQFLPSSIRKYAVDFDEDGKIDLRHSPVDAIGSVAHFLSQHGWETNKPIIFPISFSPDCVTPPETLLGKKLKANLTKADLSQICPVTKNILPDHILFGLIDLPNSAAPTEYWLGTNNFFVITKYNRSYFYAMSVIELGLAAKARHTSSKK